MPLTVVSARDVLTAAAWGPLGHGWQAAAEVDARASVAEDAVAQNGILHSASIVEDYALGVKADYVGRTRGRAAHRVVPIGASRVAPL
jgi:hypothetical protein